MPRSFMQVAALAIAYCSTICVNTSKCEQLPDYAKKQQANRRQALRGLKNLTAYGFILEMPPQGRLSDDELNALVESQLKRDEVLSKLIRDELANSGILAKGMWDKGTEKWPSLCFRYAYPDTQIDIELYEEATVNRAKPTKVWARTYNQIAFHRSNSLHESMKEAVKAFALEYFRAQQ